jgi:hypothetical protein
MKKVLLVILGLCIAISSYAASKVANESNQPNVNAANSAVTAVNKQNNLPQVSKAKLTPSVILNKPSKGDVWQVGKSYDVVWETRFLSAGSLGIVILNVMPIPQGNLQPVNNIPLNGTINYKVPFPASSWGPTPHGKRPALLIVKFVDKATNKEYRDEAGIYVQYP